MSSPSQPIATATAPLGRWLAGLFLVPLLACTDDTTPTADSHTGVSPDSPPALDSAQTDTAPPPRLLGRGLLSAQGPPLSILDHPPPLQLLGAPGTLPDPLESATGHPVFGVELADLVFRPGMSAWFPAVTTRGRVLVSTMSINGNPTNAMSEDLSVGLLDPGVWPYGWVTRVLPTTNGTTVTHAALVEPPRGGADVSDLCNLGEDRIVGISAVPYHHWNPDDESGLGRYPSVLVFEDSDDDDDDGDGSPIDYLPSESLISDQLRATPLPSDAPEPGGEDYPAPDPQDPLDPPPGALEADLAFPWSLGYFDSYGWLASGVLLNECDTLSGGELAIAQYGHNPQAPDLGYEPHSGRILVLDPGLGVAGFLPLPEYTVQGPGTWAWDGDADEHYEVPDGTPVHVLPRQVRADGSGADGGGRFAVIFDVNVAERGEGVTADALPFAFQVLRWHVSSGTLVAETDLLVPAQTDGQGHTYTHVVFDSAGRLAVTRADHGYSLAGFVAAGVDLFAPQDWQATPWTPSDPPGHAPQAWGMVAQPAAHLEATSWGPPWDPDGRGKAPRSVHFDPTLGLIWVDVNGRLGAQAWDPEAPLVSAGGAVACDVDLAGQALVAQHGSGGFTTRQGAVLPAPPGAAHGDRLVVPVQRYGSGAEPLESRSQYLLLLEPGALLGGTRTADDLTACEG